MSHITHIPNVLVTPGPLVYHLDYPDPQIWISSTLGNPSGEPHYPIPKNALCSLGNIRHHMLPYSAPYPSLFGTVCFLGNMRQRMLPYSAPYAPLFGTERGAENLNIKGI